MVSECTSDYITKEALVRKDNRHRYDRLGVQVRFTKKHLREAYEKLDTFKGLNYDTSKKETYP